MNTVKAGILLVFLTTGSSSNGSTPNYLTKIFCHKGTLSDKMAFYFSHEPMLTHLPERTQKSKNGWKTFKFLLPQTEVGSAQAQAVIKELNGVDAPTAYGAHFEMVAIHQGPKPGLLITIQYDPVTIGFRYETFTAIQQQPGVLFTFHHKQALRRLSDQANPVRHYAQSKKKTHIVVDSGHGGEDLGKVGCNDIKEKEINLAVTMKVASLLRKDGFVVSLTRNADRFVPVESRTTFANTVAKADLFVSIHSNGAANATASGVETFCVIPDLGAQPITDLDGQLALCQKMLSEKRAYESFLLAESLQHYIVSTVRSKEMSLVDRKVKKAAAQVLLATEAPAALIEIGFLSNYKEAKLLASEEYQNLLARGICNGIRAYVNCQRA